MKQKLKKLKLLLTISLAGLLLNSCQEEFDESYSESKNHNLVKEYTFKQASQKPKFNNAYHKFANGLDQMKRTNKSMDSDFVIDSTLVKEVTLNNQTTYTMAIKRAIPNDTYFENLIVQVKNGDSTRAYIAKYTPSKEMIYFQEHNSYTFEAASEIKEIVFDTSSFQNKITLVCFSVLVCNQGGDWHIAGEHCTQVSDGTGCFEVEAGDSSGPGNGSDGLSSSSGGSSSGGSSSGGVPTAPVPVPVPPSILNPEPCVKIKAKTTNNAAYMNNFNNLNTTANLDLPFETGFFEKKENGNTQYAYGTPSGAGTVNFPSGTCISFTHIHPNKPTLNPDGIHYDANVKMLSPTDLKAIIRYCASAAVSAGLTPLDAQGIMISNEGIFSLNIIDSNIDFALFFNNYSEFETNYYEESNKIISDNTLSASDRSEQLQQMMLKQLDFLGLKDKIALFEGTVTPGASGNELNWNQKTLNKFKKVVPNPC